MNKRREHKYKVIAKTGTIDFKKWNTSDLISFTRFLDKEHPNWRWFNVYDKRTKEQLGNFTINDKPKYKYI